MVANMTQDGPKRGQDGPRWPDKGSQAYDHRIYPLIGARVGGHFGAILGYLGASGANLGVFEGALGLDCWALSGKVESNMVQRWQVARLAKTS